MRERLHLTFPRQCVTEPVICQIAKEFDVVYSIRRANVEPEAGWMDLEFNGEEAEIGRAVAYLEERGVQVSPVGGDILAG